jgi:hypothetical protein
MHLTDDSLHINPKFHNFDNVQQRQFDIFADHADKAHDFYVDIHEENMTDGEVTWKQVVLTAVEAQALLVFLQRELKKAGM